MLLCHFQIERYGNADLFWHRIIPDLRALKTLKINMYMNTYYKKTTKEKKSEAFP